MKDKETPLLLVLSSWNNKKQTDEKQGFAPLLTINKRNIEMKNKETPFLFVLSSWNNKEQTDEKQERTHFADRSVLNRT